MSSKVPMSGTASGKLNDIRTLTMSVVKGLVFAALGWVAIFVFGCGSSQARSSPAIVPISTFQPIAGKWEGLSKRVPDMRDHAQVIVSINEKGHFSFVSDRRTELLLGTGTLTILDGHVIGTSGSGTSTCTLHDKAGRSLLVVEAALNDGNHYYLEMTPMK